MYLNYWGFKEAPFENVPDRNFFFRSSHHEEALSRMMYAAEQRKGIAMLTGEVGSGKTTISRVLKDTLPADRYNVQSIVNPALSPLDFIRAILLCLGEEADTDSKVILLNRLQERLIGNASKGLNNILIIDEAHLITTKESLQELRMLLNIQSEHQFLITLIILGQPPLLKTILDLRHLKERISIKYHLPPLDLKDTIRYILFRMKRAGAKRGIFTKEAIFPLYEYTRGVPLRINNLCDRSLLIGMMKQTKDVKTGIVNSAIKDLS